ncbi:DNA-processing protein DprA [Flavobacterium sp. CS20]|uniref:DNA-processing protein DprA n=1 Tax=Flavobacterium sp. CS20 TaxID=2775246 RepID=UPI001B3A3CB2|nr:DNA-processing protein DprA [Flavobacterium sp. CS20]QTY26640.1 DNA-processing protein DprA [Flavobacterium sp. CS20]
MSHQEKIYLLALHRLSYIGDTTAKKLIEILGSAEAIFKEKSQNLQKINGLGTKRIQTIKKDLDLDGAENELKFIEDNDIDFLYFKDKTYPINLKHCIDGPLVLFQKGNIDLQNKRIISIVGTRNITSHGIQFTEQLISDLAVFDPVIVSGFAYGTDITAQKVALHHNLQTIGCFGHGMNQVYPKAHQKYVHDIMKHGGFFTDFCSDDKFDRNNFLKRNRIIAGLSEATIVIESLAKGGSLVTAEMANGYNREVFALPGRYSDKMSIGCNNLIKKQQAMMLTCLADLAYILNWDVDQKPKPAHQTQLFVDLNEEEKIVVESLKSLQKTEIDPLALSCQIPTSKLSTILLNLELKGLVRPLPGKQFELI